MIALDWGMWAIKRASSNNTKEEVRGGWEQGRDGAFREWISVRKKEEIKTRGGRKAKNDKDILLERTRGSASWQVGSSRALREDKKGGGEQEWKWWQSRMEERWEESSGVGEVRWQCQRRINCSELSNLYQHWISTISFCVCLSTWGPLIFSWFPWRREQKSRGRLYRTRNIMKEVNNTLNECWIHYLSHFDLLLTWNTCIVDVASNIQTCRRRLHLSLCVSSSTLFLCVTEGHLGPVKSSFNSSGMLLQHDQWFTEIHSLTQDTVWGNCAIVSSPETQFKHKLFCCCCCELWVVLTVKVNSLQGTTFVAFASPLIILKIKDKLLLYPDRSWELYFGCKLCMSIFILFCLCTSVGCC